MSPETAAALCPIQPTISQKYLPGEIKTKLIYTPASDLSFVRYNRETSGLYKTFSHKDIVDMISLINSVEE